MAMGIGDHGGKPVLTFDEVEIKPLGIIEYARNNQKQELLNAVFNRRHAHKTEDLNRLKLAIACNQKDYVEQHKMRFSGHASDLFHYAIRCGDKDIAQTFLLEIPEKKRQASYQQARKLVHPYLPSTESISTWLDSVKMTGLTEKEQYALKSIQDTVVDHGARVSSIQTDLRDLQENLTALNSQDEK